MNLRGEKRTEFSQKVRKAAFARCCRNGVPYCEGPCGLVLSARSGIIYDHIQPDGLGGEPTLENCAVLCRTCHGVKTTTEDSPRMAKADRVAKAHYGLKKSGRPMPGSKRSGLKKRMDGTVVKR
jgi:5-methylcytosine-specific restriction endonuclease McrA